MDGAVKLTGLWKQKDKNGMTFLSGSLSPISKVIILPNSYKKAEKDPDYFFYLGANEKKDQAKPAQRMGEDL